MMHALQRETARTPGRTHRVLGVARQFATDLRNIIQAQVALRYKRLYLPSLFGHYTVNSVCNLRCSYCYVGQSEIFPEGFTNGGLPIDRAKRVVGNLRRECVTLRIQGGEPLLYPGICELVRYAKRDLRYWHVSLITNGLGLLRRRERWDGLFRDLDLVTLSLDTTRRDQYPKLVAQIIDALPSLASWCRRHGVTLTLNYTASWDDLAHPDRVRRFVDPIRVHFANVYVLPVRVAGKTPLPWLRSSVALNRRYSVVNDSFPDYPETERLSWYKEHCDPKLKIKVDATGGLVYPCENHSTSAGSLEEHTIRELWTAQRVAYPNESCVGCGKQRWRSDTLRQPVKLAIAARRLAPVAGQRTS